MMIEPKFKFLTVNFNSSSLTELCVRSIQSFYPNADITIFNNSGVLEIENCNIIDNTKNKVVDFDKYSFKRYSSQNSNGGSAKHAMSIDFALNHIFDEDDNVILMDNDTYLIKDVIKYIKEKDYYNVVTIGDSYKKKRSIRTRFKPFIQYFNTKNMRLYKIRYFDQNRITQLQCGDDSYDTGASFYEDVVTKKLNYLKFNSDEFIRHLGGGSWYSKGQKKFLEDGYSFIKQQDYLKYCMNGKVSI